LCMIFMFLIVPKDMWLLTLQWAQELDTLLLLVQLQIIQ
jgi:hypothetical protein